MMQLCYGCRHAFPASSLAPCVFSDIISHRFEEVHKIVKEMETKTPEENHRIVQLQTVIRELYSAVHQEIGALKERQAHLEAARERDRQDIELGTQSRLSTTQGNNIMSNTQIFANNTSRQPHTKIVPRATFNGTVPIYKLRKMNSALELVSASIYTVVESLAIRTRAAVAMLWLPPPGVVSTELVAPFVVGRDMSKLRNSAPYRVFETSLPCLVSETGIAVNLKPKYGISNPKMTESIPLMDLIEAPNTSQLIVPVFTRYGEVQRSVLGVVHLVSNPMFPCPFSLRNEEMTVQTAATLSVILSSYYETMGAEWANRIYDPSLLLNTSAYQSALDMRSAEKVVDDFAPSPVLIYRCKNDREEDDDAREVVKSLRCAMTRRAAPRKSVWSVKDMHRFAMNMKQNWISVLNSNAEMETRIAELEDKVLRNELQRKKIGTVSHPELLSKKNSDASVPAQRPSSALIPRNVLPPVVDKHANLKPEQVNEMEMTALRRLQNMGVDTTAFLMTKEAQDV